MLFFNRLIALTFFLPLLLQAETIPPDTQEQAGIDQVNVEPSEIKLIPQIRRESLADAPVPTLPLHVLQPFLMRARVISLEDFEAAPRVLGFTQEHIVGGTGDEFYANNMDVADVITNNFDVLRLGKVYIDPDSGDNLGYEALRIGSAMIVKSGTTAKLLLINTNREVQLDDRIIPAEEEDFAVDFIPTPASSMIEGKIIALLNGINEIGIYSVVALNKGEEDGLKYGDTMKILQQSFAPCKRSLTLEVYTYHPISCDEKFNISEHVPLSLNTNEENSELPFEVIGNLMIFKVFTRISYAIVLHATSVIHIGNGVRGAGT